MRIPSELNLLVSTFLSVTLVTNIMQVGILSLLLSLCVASAVGRGVLMEIDVETIKAIPLLEAETITQVKTLLQNCTKANDTASVNSVNVSPTVPVKGQPISVNMSITFKEEVSGGKVALKVKFGVVPIFSKEFKLCDIATDAQLTCPIEMGTHSLAMTKEFPSAIPSGHFTGSIIATDQESREVVCFTFDLEL